jgi:hypothetical protein
MITARDGSSSSGPSSVTPPVFRSWPTPRMVILLATVLGAGVLLDLPVELLGLAHARNQLAPMMLVTTLVLSIWLVRRALRSDSSAANVAWCLAGGAMAGACNAIINYLVFLTGAGLGGFLQGLAVVIPLWWLFALIGGVPGLIYGLTFLPLCELSLRVARAPSHRDAWVASYWGGSWLLLVSLASQVTLGRGTVLAALAGAVGMLLLSVTLVREAQLVAWLRRLRRGQGGWQLSPRDPNRAYRGLLPLGRWVAPALCDDVLVHAASGQGPYRTTLPTHEIALVPAEVDRYALEDLGRTVLTLAVGVCLIALLP